MIPVISFFISCNNSNRVNEKEIIKDPGSIDADVEGNIETFLLSASENKGKTGDSLRLNFLPVLQFSRIFRKVVIFSAESIPAKDHQAEGDRSKDANNNNPDHGVINVFFACRINMHDGPVYKKIDDGRGQQQPDNA